MSISIRTAKEVLKQLKTKTVFSVKFAGEPKEVILTKKISLVGKGRFGGTDIVLRGSDGMHYFIKDSQSLVKGVGPNSPSEGINKIFSVTQVETNKEMFLSVKREPKKQELPVWFAVQKSSKETKDAVKTIKRSDDWKILLDITKPAEQN